MGARSWGSAMTMWGKGAEAERVVVEEGGGKGTGRGVEMWKGSMGGGGL